MKLDVELDDDTARRLDAVAKASGESRSAVVRRAVAEWLARRRAGWPAVILEYRGDASLRAFESYRDEFRPPSDDPLTPPRADDRRRRG